MHIFLVMLLALLASGQEPKPSPTPQKCAVDYDRFTDMSTVSTGYFDVTGNHRDGLAMSLIFAFKGKQLTGKPGPVLVSFASGSPDWRFRNRQSVLRGIIDGKRADVGAPIRDDIDVRSGYVKEYLSMYMPLSGLEILAKAKKVELQLGPYEFELTPRHSATLKAFLSHCKS